MKKNINTIRLIVKHFQRILNECGDNVVLSITENYIINDSCQYSIELDNALVLKKNSVFELKTPEPSFYNDTEENYNINRIRISEILINDYSNGFTYDDNQILNILKTKQSLFAFYESDTGY